MSPIFLHYITKLLFCIDFLAVWKIWKCKSAILVTVCNTTASKWHRYRERLRKKILWKHSVQGKFCVDLFWLKVCILLLFLQPTAGFWKKLLAENEKIILPDERCYYHRIQAISWKISASFFLPVILQISFLNISSFYQKHPLAGCKIKAGIALPCLLKTKRTIGGESHRNNKN